VTDAQLYTIATQGCRRPGARDRAPRNRSFGGRARTSDQSTAVAIAKAGSNREWQALRRPILRLAQVSTTSCYMVHGQGTFKKNNASTRRTPWPPLPHAQRARSTVLPVVAAALKVASS